MDDAGKRLIIALDFPTLDRALDLARTIASEIGMFKVGLELFNSAGPRAIEALRELGPGIFYDAKLHDIPNTVAGAAAAAGRLGVAMVNVHALGGRAMMEAAKQGAARGAREAGFPPPLVIGVTVLTSLGQRELEELGLQGQEASSCPTGTTGTGQVVGVVPRLALLAREAGLDGVVASVHEVPEIKRACGREFVTVTPGIRPSWADPGDQVRTATPRSALGAGADYLVIGRPVTRADDPRQALARILREMAQ